MFLDQFKLWAAAYSMEIIAVMALVCLLLVIAGVVLAVKIRALQKRYRAFMMDCEGLNLEELLNHYGKLITGGLDKQQQVEHRLTEVERLLQSSLAGVGLVRYNAFRETGSDLSFSLALLDRHQNGVIVTSIFGRDESRCYGKPVHRGKSTILLSEEEEESLAVAKRGMII